MAVFCAGVFIFLFPLALDLTRENRGLSGPPLAFFVPNRLGFEVLLSQGYLKTFFWGEDFILFSHGPLWGGLLNPFLSSFFFLGLAHLFKAWKKPLNLWTLSALPVFFLPALLTNNVEMMRLVALLPILLGVCALGAWSFLSYVAPKKRLLVFLLILAGSCAFDFFHLFRVYPRFAGNNPSFYGSFKSPEFSKAYSLLKPMASQNGPGLILLNFNPDPYDQTLFVTTYSFNSAENPRLDPSPKPDGPRFSRTSMNSLTSKGNFPMASGPGFPTA